MQTVNEQIAAHNNAIGLLLEIATANTREARNKAKHDYAEHMQQMFEQHVEKAIEQVQDQELMAEIFGAELHLLDDDLENAAREEKMESHTRVTIYDRVKSC